MKRREFLKTGALVVVGTAVAASGLVNAADASAPMRKLTALKPAEAETLFKVSRQIFPHNGVGDEPYWKVVAALDASAQSDPADAKLLAEGVAQLDSSRTAKFADLSSAQQVEVLKSIEGTPFFQKVRGVELQTLYGDPAVFKAMGYQGSSYQMGGYVHHGFNDLDWLPDPPEGASPKPA